MARCSGGEQEESARSVRVSCASHATSRSPFSHVKAKPRTNSKPAQRSAEPVLPSPPSLLQSEAHRRRPTSKGKQRTADILRAARDLLEERGIEGFTVRGIAERVGISLSNLQHYFPTREQILEVLCDEVACSYDAVYRSVTSPRQSGEARLKAILTYFMNDISNPRTERFFMEMWSLAIRDQKVRDIVDRMYARHLDNLKQLIAEINPQLSPRRVAHRACLVAAQMEGLMIIVGSDPSRHVGLRGVHAECVRTILFLAKAP